MNKFKCGQKAVVVATPSPKLDYLVGRTITIKRAVNDCYKIVEDPSDSWWSAGRFKEFAPNKIVITTDGYRTIARLYENERCIKMTSAKCHPDDSFDFLIGASIATDRLFKPLYNARVCCYSSLFSQCWTAGKIYEVLNGVIVADTGETYTNIENLEHLNFRFSAKFIELVED